MSIDAWCIVGACVDPRASVATPTLMDQVADSIGISPPEPSVRTPPSFVLYGAGFRWTTPPPSERRDAPVAHRVLEVEDRLLDRRRRLRPPLDSRSIALVGGSEPVPPSVHPGRLLLRHP